ncbi:MAG: glycosyltransferase family 2 protein [Planctomycetales bacterium]|nr:glycosyltransferase family 2 protein [Planctomycetales bacterium]
MDDAPLSTAESDALPYSPKWFESLRRQLGDVVCRHLGFYAIPPDLTLSVVIPVYNERDSLLQLLDRVKAVPIRKEIVLVDDGSTDGTRDLLKELETQQQATGSTDTLNTIQVFFHEKNAGKGAALRTGFTKATGDIVLIQDADLEYDPAEYPRLIQPIIEGKADVVYGSRFLGDYSHRVLYYWHYLGNQFLTMLSNCFTNLNLTDMETCYKVFRREIIQEIAPKLQQNRFGFEPEITARVARKHYRIYELSISYSGRTYDQGKKIGWKDGISALWCIVRYSLAD